MNEAPIAHQIRQQPKKHATKRPINVWLDTEQRFHELLIESARNPLLAKVTHERRAIGQIFDAQRDGLADVNLSPTNQRLDC